MVGSVRELRNTGKSVLSRCIRLSYHNNVFIIIYQNASEYYKDR